MAVLELFSTRQKRVRGEMPDVYRYDELPNPLRVQIVHLWREGFGTATQEGYGVTCPVLDYFLGCGDVERALDVVELTFTYLSVMTHGDRFGYTAKTTPIDAINELNQRFKQHGIGYSFESEIHKVVRIDSQFAHSDVVKPALSILGEKRFRGANEEFAKAHQHYRERRYQECIADCLKAFESTIKVICATQKWTFDINDTSKALIKLCFERGLIPGYFESQFSSVRTLLESGVPTVRNKTSGHGQGTDIRTVPPHLAAYALHLTATNIVFLAECEKALTT